MGVSCERRKYMSLFNMRYQPRDGSLSSLMAQHPDMTELNCMHNNLRKLPFQIGNLNNRDNNKYIKRRTLIYPDHVVNEWMSSIMIYGHLHRTTTYVRLRTDSITQLYYSVRRFNSICIQRQPLPHQELPHSMNTHNKLWPDDIMRISSHPSLYESLSLKSSMEFLSLLISHHDELYDYKNENNMKAVIRLVIKDLHHDVHGLKLLSKAKYCNLTENLSSVWSFHRDQSIMNLQGKIALSKLNEFDMHELSGIVLSFSKTEVQVNELFETVASKVLAGYEEMTTECISNIAEAFARYKYDDSDLFHRLIRLSRLRISEFKSNDLCRLAWSFAFANKKYCDKQLFNSIAKSHKLFTLDSNGAQIVDHVGAALLLYAFVESGFYSRDLLTPFEPLIHEHIHKYSGKQLCDIAWAFSSAGIHSEHLFIAIAIESKKHTGRFNLDDVSNMAWSFARSGFCFEKFFRLLAREAKNILNIDSNQCFNETVMTSGVPDSTKLRLLSTIVRSFSNCKVRDDKLFEAIAPELIRLSSYADSRNITAIACGFSEFGSHNITLFETMALSAQNQLDTFKPNEICLLLRAFVISSIRSDDLFLSAASEFRDRICEFTPKMLSNIAWAFAMNGVSHVPFFEAMLEPFCGSNELRSDSVIRIAWSYVTSLHDLSDRMLYYIVPGLVKVARRTLNGSQELSVPLKNQMWLALHVIANSNKGSFSAACGKLVDPFSRICHTHRERSSSLHFEVSAELTKLGIKHKCEIPVCNGLFWSDIYFEDPLDGMPTVIEVNGPYHYFFNDKTKLNGKTLSKQRILRKSGFRVLSIPYFEWTQSFSPQYKPDYLKRLLFSKTED